MFIADIPNPLPLLARFNSKTQHCLMLKVSGHVLFIVFYG